MVRLRLAVEGGGRGGDGVLPGAGEHRGRAGRDRPHAARPDGDLGRKLLADAGQAAAAGGDAVHLQRAEDCHDAGADRRHRGRVLRLARPCGMGFRISTEVGRLALDMVWAEIVVAALAGSAFYGLVALVEKAGDLLAPVAAQYEGDDRGSTRRLTR